MNVPVRAARSSDADGIAPLVRQLGYEISVADAGARFNNIKIAGPLISKMAEAYALASKVSAAWVSFARTGNPDVSGLPKWPAYSAASRDTMLFSTASHVEQDPDRGPRVAMEHELKLS